MGREAIYKCKKCGNEFKANEGCGWHFCLYRCVNCDNTKEVLLGMDEKKIGVCKKCGGELKDDLKPMCPNCKSRKVVEKEILTLWD